MSERPAARSETFLPSLLTGVLLALAVAAGMGEPGGGSADPADPSLRLISREGRPWILLRSPRPVAAVFEMESSARREVIGVAEGAATSQALALPGWLGDGGVRVHVRTVPEVLVPPLELRPSHVEPYLDTLATRIVAGQRGEAWEQMGRYSSLYFSTGVGDLDTKRRLQRLLVTEGPLAGPGGAAWLWGERFRPRRHSALIGAREVEASERSAGHLAPGPEGAVHFDLPPLPEGAVCELCAVVEVSPTPAPPYRLLVEVQSGFPLLLLPGAEGGQACQAVDGRALAAPEGAGLELFLEVPGIGGEELRAEAARVWVRYLPGESGGGEGERLGP